MFNEAPPLLVRVTDCAALLVPTCWLAKVRLVVERLTAGPVLAPACLKAAMMPMHFELFVHEVVVSPDWVAETIS